MLSQLRPRSIYDVMAVIAMVAALGTGTAYAANTVFSADIVDGEVKNPDLGPDAVTSAKILNANVALSDLAPNSVSGAKVFNNSLTGDDIKESTLGKVPDADTLDGLDSSEIKVRWRGAYLEELRYAARDAVSYQGSSYIAVVDAPECLPGDCEDWNVMAAKGEDGDQGPPGIANVTLRQQSQSIPPNGLEWVRALCHAGEWVTGGGYYKDERQEILATLGIQGHQSIEGVANWYVLVKNRSTTDSTSIEVRAMCAAP